jgi:hypothetical protein
VAPPRNAQPASGRVIGWLLSCTRTWVPTRIVHRQALIPPTPVDALPSNVQSILLPLFESAHALSPRVVDVTRNEAIGAVDVTVSVAVCVAPPNAAVMVTGVDALTDDVVMVNVALVAPADTVTDEGTTAAALLLVSATTALPAGAAADNVTVP